MFERFFNQINLQVIMRKSKFVNPFQSLPLSSIDQYSPIESSQKHPFVQNKIYFPLSQFDKLMPYNYELLNHRNKKSPDKMHSSQLYQIKEKPQTKQKVQRKSSFRRQNKFQKLQAQKTIDCTQNKSKSLIKYNTLQFKNLQGINFTSSGTTIYRSKNIKSLGKFIFQQSPRKRGKSQLNRNLTTRNQQSSKHKLSKSKSNNQATLKQRDKKIVLYEAYFSSRPDLNQRSNSLKPTQNQDISEQENQRHVLNYEDILCRSLIEAQIYRSFTQPDQQQFF